MFSSGVMQVPTYHISDEVKGQLISKYAMLMTSVSPMHYLHDVALLAKMQKRSADILRSTLPPEALAQIESVAQGDTPFVCFDNLPGLRYAQGVFAPYTPENISDPPELGQMGEMVLLGLTRLTGGALQAKDDIVLDHVIKGWPVANAEPWHTHGHMGVAGVYGYRGPENAPVRVISAHEIYDRANEAIKESLLKPYHFFEDEEPLPVMQHDRHGHLVFSERFTRGENYDDLLERIAAESLPVAEKGDKEEMLAYLHECFTNPEHHYEFIIRPGTLFLTDQSQTLRCSDSYHDPASDDLVKRWGSSCGISHQAVMRHRDQLRADTVPDDPAWEVTHAERVGMAREIMRHSANAHNK